MGSLNIDGRAYELENLNPEARQHIANIRLVDQELQRLQVQIGIAQTARAAYAKALKALLPKDAPNEPSPLERAMAAGTI